jgi:hypothetical protein
MWHVRRREECLQGLGGKPEIKIPSGKHRHIWQHNIKIDHQEMTTLTEVMTTLTKVMTTLTEVMTTLTEVMTTLTEVMTTLTEVMTILTEVFP